MDRIWSPWRMQYIESAKVEGGACILCEKPRESKDAENLILHRGRLCYIIMNLYPYNNGHLMVVPYKHVPDMTDLDDATLLEMMQFVRLSETLLRQVMRPDGFNIGANIGRVAGAGIADHVHMHVVPRWMGDTNFMPVLADVHVMPELLATTYAKLKDGLLRLLAEGQIGAK